jgi:hypothetical protein
MEQDLGDDEKARDSLSFSKVLAFHIDRILKAKTYAQGDYGNSYFYSVDGLGRVLVHFLNKEPELQNRMVIIQAEIDKITKKPGLNRGTRIGLSDQKLQILMELMDKRGLLGQGEESEEL